MKDEDNVALSKEAAKRHHQKHGDMSRGWCLLSHCALHYPEDAAEYRELLERVRQAGHKEW